MELTPEGSGHLVSPPMPLDKPGYVLPHPAWGDASPIGRRARESTSAGDMGVAATGTAFVVMGTDILRRATNGPRQSQLDQGENMICHRWEDVILRATVIGIALVLSGASASEPAEPRAARQESGPRAESDARHELFLVSLKVKETKAGGSSGDPAGGKPDLRIILTNERSGKTFISNVVKDTDSVKFDLKDRVLDVAEGDILGILVFDEDLIDHDIMGLSTMSLTSGILAKTELDLSFGRVDQLRVEFRPRK